MQGGLEEGEEYEEAVKRNLMWSVARDHLRAAGYFYYVFVSPGALPGLMSGPGGQQPEGRGEVEGAHDESAEEEEEGLVDGCVARSWERHLHVWQPALGAGVQTLVCARAHAQLSAHLRGA